MFKNVLVTICFLTLFNPVNAFSSVKIQLVVSPSSNSCWAVEDAIQNLSRIYGSNIIIKISFFVEEDERGEYYSQLGENDFQELIRQAVIREYFPGKLWKYISCRNSEIYNPIWEHSALWAGINPEKIEGWVNKSKLKKLLDRDGQIIKKYGIENVPAIIIDNKLVFQGEIGMPEIDFAIKRRLTREYQTEVNTALIIYDPQTAQPDLLAIKKYLEKYIVGVAFVEQPITAELVKALLKNEITTLPAVFMEGRFERTYYLKYLSSEPVRHFQGRCYIPLPRFVDTLIDRERIPGKLQVIMQAYCPASVDLMHQLIEIRKRNEKTELSFPCFLYEQQERRVAQLSEERSLSFGERNGYSAIHGEKELIETARQLIIQNRYPNKYWDYLENLYRDGFDLPDKALEKVNISTNEIENILVKEGGQYLLENYTKVKTIPLAQSPTLIVDNRYLVADINQYFNGQIKIEGSCGAAR